jgi:hypothetical protein
MEPQAELARFLLFQRLGAPAALSAMALMGRAALLMQHCEEQLEAVLFLLWAAHLAELLIQGQAVLHTQLPASWVQAPAAPAAFLPQETEQAALVVQSRFSTNNHELRNHQFHWPCR